MMDGFLKEVSNRNSYLLIAMMRWNCNFVELWFILKDFKNEVLKYSLDYTLWPNSYDEFLNNPFWGSCYSNTDYVED